MVGAMEDSIYLFDWVVGVVLVLLLWGFFFSLFGVLPARRFIFCYTMRGIRRRDWVNG